VRGRRTAGVASFLVLLAEAFGTLLMWAPIPLAWFWIGARVYDATHSIMADGIVVLGGFLVTVIAVLKVLTRLDELWIELRRRAGHEQREGALNQIVIVSATFGVIAFWVWFHIIEDAFIIPFMPTES
jgi:hypothetical protein